MQAKCCIVLQGANDNDAYYRVAVAYFCKTVLNW